MKKIMILSCFLLSSLSLAQIECSGQGGVSLSQSGSNISISIAGVQYDGRITMNDGENVTIEPTSGNFEKAKLYLDDEDSKLTVFDKFRPATYMVDCIQ